MFASRKEGGGLVRTHFAAALAVVGCVVLVVALIPLNAFGYLDEFGGGGTEAYLPFTEPTTLHPDRLDEIAARQGYLPFTQPTALHPDRLDEIAARQEYLPYTEQHVLPSGSHELDVHFADEKPGAVDSAGRALLSDETQALGRSVLIESGGTLYQLMHE